MSIAFGMLLVVAIAWRSAILVSVASLVAGYWGARRCRRFSGDINPGVVYGISAGTTFGGANVVYCLALGSRYREVFLKYGNPRFLFPAACIGLIGTAAPLVAYYVTSKRLAQSHHRVGYSMTRIATRRFAYSLIAASIIARLYPPIPAAFGSLSAIIDLGPSVSIFILRLDHLSLRPRRSAGVWLPLAIMVAEIVYSAAFEFLRTAMIWPCLAYLLPLFMVGQRRRYSRAARFALCSIAVAAFMIVFVQFGETRQRYTGTERLNAAFFGSVEADAPNEANTAIDGAIAVVARLSTLNQLSALESVVSDEGTLRGETLKPLLIGPIPRLLWPNKPNIIPGQEFARRLGRGSELPNGRFSNAINATLPGDFRLNFGWFAAIGGSMLLGILLAWGWSLCGEFTTTRNAAAASGAFLLLTQSVFVGSNAAVLFDVLSSIAAAWLLGLGFRNFGRRRHTGRETETRPTFNRTSQSGTATVATYHREDGGGAGHGNKPL